jgi:Mycothiol maleylpyruvate isomerase N-terminal domain
VTDKQDAIAKLETRYEAFRLGIADLPDAAFRETWLGTWNLSQLLAHMCGWYGEMGGAIGRVARGEPPTPAGVDYSDSDTWNARFAHDAKPGRAALAAWDAAFTAYRDAAAALPDALFGMDPEKGRPRIGNRLLQVAGIGHFEEHQPELDRWLASRRK